MSKNNRLRQSQLYFSSSDENDDPQTAQTQHPQPLPIQAHSQQNRSSHQQNQNDPLNELSGDQLFDIFCNDKKMNEIWSEKLNQTEGSGVKILWRLHYIIGQIIIHIQEYLVSSGRLQNCILLKEKQIQKISLFLIEQAEQHPQDGDYLKARQNMSLIYRHHVQDIKLASVLYNYFNKIVFQPLQFEMHLHFDHKQTTQIVGPNRYTIQSPVSQNQITKSHYCNTPSFQNKIKPKPQYYSVSPMNSNIQSNRGSVSNLKQPIDLNSQQKGTSLKWASWEECIFCKIYSSHDSPSVCNQLLEKQLGSDARWSSPHQIQQKMQLIVTKVFNKFATLNTTNQHIKAFRDNRKIVLHSSSPTLRKRMFRNIAIIYESMLNINEEKKVLISNKIIEVNKMCSQVALVN